MRLAHGGSLRLPSSRCSAVRRRPAGLSHVVRRRSENRDCAVSPSRCGSGSRGGGAFRSDRHRRQPRPMSGDNSTSTRVHAARVIKIFHQPRRSVGGCSPTSHGVGLRAAGYLTSVPRHLHVIEQVDGRWRCATVGASRTCMKGFGGDRAPARRRQDPATGRRDDPLGGRPG